MAAFASIQPQPGAIRMRSVCKSPVILASATHGNGNSIATAMNLASLKATGPSGRWQRGNVAIESIHPPGPSSRHPPPSNKALFPHWPISSIGIASLPAIRCGNQPDPIHISRHQMAANPSEHFQRAVINASLNIPTDDTQSNTHQNKTEENGSQWNKKKKINQWRCGLNFKLTGCKRPSFESRLDYERVD